MKKIDSEKAIERKLVERLRSVGGVCVKLLSDQNSGMPDRLCVYRGRHFFVELKTTGKKPRKIQLAMHEKLRSCGAEVYVVDTLQGVDDLMESITEQLGMGYFNNEEFSI